MGKVDLAFIPEQQQRLCNIPFSYYMYCYAMTCDIKNRVHASSIRCLLFSLNDEG